MTAHHALGASSSHRWLNCLGSVDAEKGYKNTSSRSADEGTAAHELAELALDGGGKAADFIGQYLPEMTAWQVTQEMADYVQVYIDYVTAISGEHFYEERVSYSDWVKDAYGTADAIVIDGDTIHVIDLKYGKGVKVYAENNSQAMLYALGSYAEYSMINKLTKVKIVIAQPRLDHIDEWEISVDDLLKWGAWVSEQATLIYEGNQPRTPSEKACHWCKAKAECGALKRHTENIILSSFDELDLSNADTLTDVQLRKALESKKLIVSWLDAVESLVKDRRNDGQTFDGFKLVAGRSLRKWESEEVAEKRLKLLLGEDAYEKKILTPAKAEKVLGKVKSKDIQNIIVKPVGSPTLAPERDKRPSVSITANDFD